LWLLLKIIHSNKTMAQVITTPTFVADSTVRPAQAIQFEKSTAPQSLSTLEYITSLVNAYEKVCAKPVDTRSYYQRLKEDNPEKLREQIKQCAIKQKETRAAAKLLRLAPKVLTMIPLRKRLSSTECRKLDYNQRTREYNSRCVEKKRLQRHMARLHRLISPEISTSSPPPPQDPSSPPLQTPLSV